MIRKECWGVLVFCSVAASAPAQGDESFVIRGRLLDPAAKPVAGATVRLLATGMGMINDVLEKTATDAEGRFQIAAPKNWTRMDATQRQELTVLAVHGGRFAVVQFNRSSKPPRSEIELKLANSGGTKIEVLSPDRKPIVGAKVDIAGLSCDTIHVDLSAAELKQWGDRAKKTPIGHATGTGAVMVPKDLQFDVGLTDSRGIATVPNLAAASIGAVTVHSPEFGEQTVLHYSYQGEKTPDWPTRIVLKKTGRIAGRLVSPIPLANANREVTVSTFEHNQAQSIFHGSGAKIVTDSEGKFEAPKMVAGTVRFEVKFDPTLPTRPSDSEKSYQLKANETLELKIDLKPAVRVEGRVLEADSKKPIRDVTVRAYLGDHFEFTVSDADGKFFMWMPAGETAFHPQIPAEFLPVQAPSDYFDDAKRQKAITTFKVPEAKSFAAPPILLHRRVALRGVVLDNQGQPLRGTEISGVALSLDQRTGQPKPRDIKALANDQGEFTIAGLDPREPVRLRVSGKESSRNITLAIPGSELVRIALTPGERFHISGQVADAEGKPVADAVLEIWHRDWRPPPNVAEPKKLELKDLIRADAQGRFKTPTLPADGYVRFTIRGASVKTSESAWLDVTQPNAGSQQLVVTRLSGIAGVVRDRMGQPVPEARIALLTKEAHAETVANRQGEFTLATPGGKPFCVIVRHPDFRVEGRYYEKNPANLDQSMIRLTEPGERLAVRRLLTKEEREKALKRLTESLKQKLAKSTSADEKVSSLQSLTGILPDFVTEYLDKNPLQPATYNEMLWWQVAKGKAATHPEEAEELIARMSQGAQKAMAYAFLADGMQEKAPKRKLEVLAEALVSARSEKAPELRAVALGQVAARLFALGEKDRATAVLREGEQIAKSLSTDAFSGYARGAFATELAIIDVPAALALMHNLKDRSEFARHHGNTAHRLAGTNAAEAIKVLYLIPAPQGNEFNQHDQYAIRMCYRMSLADLPRALGLANSIADLPSRAYALGVIAQGVAKTEPNRAPELIRRAFALVEEEAARRDPPQLTSPLLPGFVACALVQICEQVDPALVRECLWRAVTLHRLPTVDSQQVWRYAGGNNALAMAAARYDGKLAEFLLAPDPAHASFRETSLATFLANPQRSIEKLELAANARNDGDLVQMIKYLATDQDQLTRLILNTLGMWRPDVEDIDF
jgi:protocatechuate 3,4-dioxygenase beta subunit